MPDQVHQIVYISRATVRLDRQAAADLNEVASEANARYGVTGLLLYDGRQFIQALEGDEAAVEAIMARIERDPRHESITYVRRGPAAARQFGTWSMNLHCVADTGLAPDLVQDVKHMIRGLDDQRLMATFIGFAVLGRPDRRMARSFGGAWSVAAA